MQEGDLKEAAERHRTALELFQRLREPAMEAVAWHQLGMVFEEARQWDEAERHYRESARIEEERGNLAGAAQTWNQLANVNILAGKPDAAERWYRKAIKTMQQERSGDLGAKALNNLANLLQTQPGRLAEVRQLAGEALAMSQTLDPGTAEIWKNYNLLAQIADREAAACADSRRKTELAAGACEHRRLARDARRNVAGTRHKLRQFAPIILAIVAACAGQAEGRAAVKQFQQMLSQAAPDWQSLSRVLDRLVAGERDETALCDGLGSTQALLIETILQVLADPSTLSDLLPSEPPETP
ncbi:hypothetical protein LBMAG56_32230 [Verrucomicrobiota bacterium]|nr:hypothetical protein LBMAG56_32230 [Verrucomicrobiota bacterium]